jgi:hypothetical protein
MRRIFIAKQARRNDHKTIEKLTASTGEADDALCIRVVDA